MPSVDATERRSGASQADSSGRAQSRRDRDRILYSDAFRRLGGVTQVATSKSTVGLHNRLTHSLKVEQVGFSLYQFLFASREDRPTSRCTQSRRLALLTTWDTRLLVMQARRYFTS